MITKENFKKLISLIQESEKELKRYEDLHILLGEERLIESHWEIQDLLISALFNERQQDFINWWIYENYMGKGWTGSPMKFRLDGRDLYTGDNIDKVWEEIKKMK